MQLSELQDNFAYWVDDLQFGYFTRPQTTRFLNNAAREVQRILMSASEQFYMTTAITPTVVNQRLYAIPADFLRSHRVEIVIGGIFPNEDKRTVLPMTPQQQDLVPGKTGDPAAYYMQGNYIVLCPVPNIPQKLLLHYSYVVPNMVNPTDVPDVPEQWHELIALFAAKDAFIKDGREHAGLQRKIDDLVLSVKRDSEERNEDSARMIVETDVSQYGTLY